MNVVDSSAWLEYLADAPNGCFFAGGVERIAELLVPSIVVIEVFKRILSQHGETDALRAVALMHQGRIVELDASLAMSAARLGAELKLPLADSVILARAREHGAIVWTQDSDFQRLEDVRYRAKRKV